MTKIARSEDMPKRPMSGYQVRNFRTKAGSPRPYSINMNSIVEPGSGLFHVSNANQYFSLFPAGKVSS